MNYIVLDLEWNQPFTQKHIKRRPFPLTGEIIQIGAVRWLKQSGSKMITLANCSEHGDFFARIKLTKVSEEKTYVSKMLYRATKGNA